MAPATPPADRWYRPACPLTAPSSQPPGDAWEAPPVPPAVPDVVAVLALVVMLAVAFAHPRAGWRWWSAWWPQAPCSDAVLSTCPPRRTSWDCSSRSWRSWPRSWWWRRSVPAKVFAAVGSIVRRAGHGRADRMLRMTFAAAALVTATLSL